MGNMYILVILSLLFVSATVNAAHILTDAKTRMIFADLLQIRILNYNNGNSDILDSKLLEIEELINSSEIYNIETINGANNLEADNRDDINSSENNEDIYKEKNKIVIPVGDYVDISDFKTRYSKNDETSEEINIVKDDDTEENIEYIKVPVLVM